MDNWEDKSELTAAQLRSVAALNGLLDPPPHEPPVPSSWPTAIAAWQPGGANTTAFVSGVSDRYLEHFNRIEDYVNTYAEMIKCITRLNYTSLQLQHHFQNVSDKTTAVRLECEQLLAEQELLAGDAERLDKFLWFFAQADRLTSRLQFGVTLVDPRTASGTGPAVNKEFLGMFETLDRCLQHTSKYADLSECRQFQQIFQRLHLKLLRIVKTHFQTELSQCRLYCRPPLFVSCASARQLSVCHVPRRISGIHKEQETPDQTLVASEADDSYFFSGISVRAFVEARGTAGHLAPLMELLQARARASAPERELLHECLQLFTSQRISVMEVPAYPVLRILADLTSAARACVRMQAELDRYFARLRKTEPRLGAMVPPLPNPCTRAPNPRFWLGALLAAGAAGLCSRAGSGCARAPAAGPLGGSRRAARGLPAGCAGTWRRPVVCPLHLPDELGCDRTGRTARCTWHCARCASASQT
jgi:hypothetical protein